MNKINIKKAEIKELLLRSENLYEYVFLQEQDSILRIFIINLLERGEDYNGRYDICVEQHGENCTTEIYAVTRLYDQQTVSIHTHINHAVGKGRSKQLLKFVLDDKSKGEFFGSVKIAPDAQQTEVEQTNRNLLLSPQATMHTRPQLEIYADDVKASHGASTGQLDESAMFYMRQRGLDEETARSMLVEAFLSEILIKIEDKEELKENTLSI